MGGRVGGCLDPPIGFHHHLHFCPKACSALLRPCVPKSKAEHVLLARYMLTSALLSEIAHGGFLVTLIDESMGMLLQINTEAKSPNRVRTSAALNPFTACMVLAHRARNQS